ncbi:MAG: DUF4255 domain-containing protein [Aureispira sp.]
MIHDVVSAIAGEINRFLQSKHNITEEKVVMSSVINLDGSVAVQEPDKIVMTLTNIEVDKTQSNVGSYKQTNKGSYKMVKPPVYVNITVLFSAYFTAENYLEGLKFIASVIAFFQSRGGAFTPQDTPEINDIVDRLQAEMVSLDMRDLSNFWSSMGSKYLPSVIYRIKTLPIKHDVLRPEIPVIKKI